MAVFVALDVRYIWMPMIPFSEVPIEAFFEFEGEYWCRWPTDANDWNARSGKRWGQFEDDEMVTLMSGTERTPSRKHGKK